MKRFISTVLAGVALVAGLSACSDTQRANLKGAAEDVTSKLREDGINIPTALPDLPSPRVTATRSPSSPTSSRPSDPKAESFGPKAYKGDFRAALKDAQALEVKGRAPKTGYDRVGQYGPSWGYDLDDNGCDARNDVLWRDMWRAEQAGDGCVVLNGVLQDNYSGESITFKRGVDTSGDVQVDHIVALGNSYVTGAQQWSQQKREEFANDPRNLEAVKGVVNSAKGDGDAATWLPPNKAYRCSYIANQVQVKKVYGLWTTPAEHDTMVRILSGC